MAADSRAFRAGSSIIAGQLALALVLTVSAGVFSAALLDVKSSPLGFEPHGLAIARVKLTSRPALQTSALRPDTAYGKSTARAAREGLMNSGWAHTTDVVHRLETLPGVISAAAANVAPFSGTASAATLREPGDASASDIQVQWRAVTEGYFRTLRIPILSGRALLASDRDYGQPYWAVLSSDGQRQLNSDGMIGKELLWGQSSPLRIIGIAGQVQHQPSDRLFGSPALYLINFRVDQVGCFLVRTSGDPRELLPAIRQTIEADGSVKVTSTAAMADIVADSMAEERFRALLTILFGAIALVLAAVGLFGLMSYHVTRRRQEIAIRMALGADTSRIRRLVMRDAAIIVAAGIAIGLPVALAAFQLLRTVLAGVQPQPMRAVAIGAATLCLAAAAAVVLPVLRAARVEPGHLLRN